jgi:putative transposase
MVTPAARQRSASSFCSTSARNEQKKVFADRGYQGERVAALLRDAGTWTLDIVKRSDAGKGFHVLPKRWIVERTLAWISRCRRLARNLENLAKTSLALIRLAMIKLMARRLTRQ